MNAQMVSCCGQHVITGRLRRIDRRGGGLLLTHMTILLGELFTAAGTLLPLDLDHGVVTPETSSPEREPTPRGPKSYGKCSVIVHMFKVYSV